MALTRDEIIHAIAVLAACDHYDEVRRAARAVTDDTLIVDVLRAADGATRLAHEIDVHRRTAA